MREHGPEPVRGLPETPPEGERILWQGSPRPWPLAKAALKVHWIAGYFAILALWRGFAAGASDGVGAGLILASWFVAIGAVAVGVLAAIAWAMARTTVYTLTSRRVAMRIGAALTMTLNLPYSRIEAADLAVARDGTGTVALRLEGGSRLAYLMLWPHARPWAFTRPQPALRAIAEPRKVAAILAEAAQARIAEARPDPRPAFAARPIAAE